MNNFFGGVRITVLFHVFMFVANLSNLQGYVREVRPRGATPSPVRGLRCFAYSFKTTLTCSNVLMGHFLVTTRPPLSSELYNPPITAYELT